MREFDPYQTWLEIPPEYRPPDHYRLLGLDPSEADAATVNAAADRRSALVRKYQLSRHSKLSQKLLNEIAAARVCLTNKKTRQEYDLQLQKVQEQPVATEPPPALETLPLLEELPATEPETDPTSTGRKPPPLPLNKASDSGTTPSVPPVPMSRPAPIASDSATNLTPFPKAATDDGPEVAAPENRRFSRRLLIAAIGGGVVLLPLLLVALLSSSDDQPPEDDIPTQQQFVIQSPRDNLDVEIRVNGALLRQVTLAKGDEEFEAPPGELEIEVLDDPKGGYRVQSARQQDGEITFVIEPVESTGELVVDAPLADIEIIVRCTGQPDRREKLAQGETRFTLPVGAIEIELASHQKTYHIPTSQGQIDENNSLTIEIQQLPLGTVVIDSQVIGAQVSISLDGKKVRDATLKRGSNSFPLPPGNIEIQPAHADAKYLVSPSSATLSDGSQASFHLFPPPPFLLAMGDSRGLTLREPRSGDVLQSLKVRRASNGLLAFTGDGQSVASAEYKSLKFWNLLSGKEENATTPYTNYLYCFAISPDGSSIALVRSGEKTVEIWDRKNDNKVRTLSGHRYAVKTVAYSHDGCLLATGSDDKTVKIWNAQKGDLLISLPEHAYSVKSVIFSPDGRLLASHDARTVIIWDISTGRKLRELAKGRYFSSVNDMAFRPDGGLLAVAGSGAVKLWNPRTGTEERTLTISSSTVYSVAFSPDGKVLVAGGSNGEAILWHADIGQQFKTIKGGTSSVQYVAFTPINRNLLPGGASAIAPRPIPKRGKYYLVIDSDTGNEKVAVFSNGEPIRELTLQKGINNLTIPSGVIEIKPVQPGAKFRIAPIEPSTTDRPFQVRYRVLPPPPYLLATAGRTDTVRIWDPRTGESIKSLTGKQGNVLSLAFSPKGSLVAAGCTLGIVMWDPLTGEEKQSWKGHDRGTHAIAFSPDGKILATAGGDTPPVVNIWDPDSGLLLRTLTGHTNRIETLAFRPNGRLLSIDRYGREFFMWEFLPGKVRKTSRKYDGSGTTVAFNQAGSMLATMQNNGEIQIRNPVNDHVLRTLSGHTGRVRSLMFSPQGRWLASGGSDNKLLLWNPLDSQVMKSISAHNSEVLFVDFSPDGLLLATGAADGSLKIWNAAAGYETKSLPKHKYSVTGLAFSPLLARP